MHSTETPNTYLLFIASLPVAAAYVPLGAAKSILMLSTGMDWYWPLIAGLLVYAGSLEFLIASYVSSGMSLPFVAWTTVLLNFRHLFYGLSYPVHRHKKRSNKIYGIFSLTDEAYVLTSIGAGRTMNGKSLITLQALMQFWWFLGSVLGVIIGQFLPENFTGFAFALTAMFILLSVDSLRQNPTLKPLAFTAVSIFVGWSAEKILSSEFFLMAGLVCYFSLLSLDYLLLRKNYAR